jgi:phenylalanyl-tRNA synthetase beta chain
MNILIPDSWLREYLQTDATPLQIQQYLSLCGPSVERIYEREGEAVYDIEVTTNRVDSMSVFGIAREAAVILPQFHLSARLQYPRLKEVIGDDTLPLPHIKNDPALNGRILCMVLDHVQHAPTPDWMAKRLRQIEMNVHDAVIDTTNYVTHALGHPCHAFDYDRVMALGGEMIVREAKAGQEFVTLDGETYTTVGGEVVLYNSAGAIIDLPSIKGTANTAVHHDTQRVLFFIESVRADKVRFASMTHAIRTVAAQLLEKRVDPHLATPTFAYGVELFGKLCSASAASATYDDFPSQKKPEVIQVVLSRITAYLGVHIPQERIVRILEDLGCTVVLRDETIVVTPPTFRPDLAIDVDIIEEIARIYGYHNLGSSIMATPIPVSRPSDSTITLEARIKRSLVAQGWQELYTYSMVSETLAEQSGWQATDHLALANPLTDDRVYLRRSLIPSLVEVLSENQGGAAQLTDVFECACVYHPVSPKQQGRELPAQPRILTCVSTRPWRQVKGDIENLFAEFFVKAVEWKKTETGAAAEVPDADGTMVTLATFSLPTSGIAACDVLLDVLLRVARPHPTYQPAPKTNVVREDLTFTVPQTTTLGPVLSLLAKADARVMSVDLKGELYKSNATLSLQYNDPAHNLEKEQVAELRNRLVTLAQHHGLTLVGQLNES